MENIVHHVLDAIHNGSDGSVHVGTGEAPTKGYMVGGASWTMTVHEDMVDAYVVMDFLNAHKAMLSWESKYVGWWRHEGRIYFDVSDNVMDYATAAQLGRDRRELCIFNLFDLEEVKV